MSDGTSVGKISLDIDLSQDLEKEIGNAADSISEKLKGGIEKGLNVEGMLKSFANGIEKTVKNSMNSIQRTVEGSLKGIESNLNNSISSVKEKAMGAIKEITSSLKNIKAPEQIFSPVSSVRVPKSNIKYATTQARAPNTEIIKAQIDNVSKSLDTTNAIIDQQKVKLAGLKESYSMAFSGTRKNELEEQILRTEQRINRLVATSDKLGFKLADLDEQFSSAGKQAENMGSKVSSANSKLSETSKEAAATGGALKKLSSLFNIFGNNAEKASNRAARGMNYTNRMINRMLIGMILYSTVMKGLSALGSFIGSALMTNTQFANSLLQIKSNLMTAFMPIYSACLPALNSLMSALAQATAYIASFISQLFGKTYKQSFNSAQAMQSQIGAMSIAEKQAKKTADSLGGIGKSANNTADSIKKAAEESKKGLSGFDEINKLGSTVPKTKMPKIATPAGSGVITPITPMANMSPIESATSAWANKFKRILRGLFTPFKQAWAAEGASTIAAAKHALQGIEDLIGSIAKSFYTVWTNGTGTRILTNMLRILQDILNIVGDIGITFANAWNKGNIGTRIVQDLANAFNNVLSLVDKMLKSVRKVFAEEGPRFADLFMQALKATSGAIENVTVKLGWIWDHGGKHAFEGLLKFAMKIGELALFIYTKFVVPFVNWFVNNISPAIAKVLDVLGSLFDKMSDLINWLMGKGEPALSVIVKTVGSIFLAFKTWEGIKKITTGVIGTVSKVKDTLETVYLKALYVKDGFIKVGSAFKTFGSGALNIAKGVGSNLLGILKTVGGGFKALWGLILANPIVAIVALIAGLVLAIIALYNHCTVFRNGVNSIFKWFKNTFGSLVNWFKDRFEDIKKTTEDKWKSIKSTTKNTWNNIKTTISEGHAAIKQSTDTVLESMKSSYQQHGRGIKGIASATMTGMQGIFNTEYNALNRITGGKLGTIVSTAGNAFSNMKNAIGSSMGSIGSIVANGFSSAISYITSLPSRAFQWGADFINGLGNGIESAFGWVEEKVSNIADTIASYLHFSAPDVGPLKNYETWMPDFMGGLASGINKNKGLVTSAIKGLSSNMNIAVKSGIQQPELAFAPGGDIQTNQENNDSSKNDAESLKDIIKNAFIDAIMALKEKDTSSNDDGSININVDEDNFARISIKALNNRRRKIGKGELII